MKNEYPINSFSFLNTEITLFNICSTSNMALCTNKSDKDTRIIVNGKNKNSKVYTIASKI